MSRGSMWFIILFFVLPCCGCGEAPNQKSASSPNQETDKQGDKNEKKPAGGAEPLSMGKALESQMIIYTATLNVVVKDLDAAAHEVEKLVAGHKAFVSKSEVKGDTGTRRVAVYTLRVPVSGFISLKEGLLTLGNVEGNAVDTQDVTEEFVDVEARIKNFQEQERKLNELMQEKRKEEKLDDVIKVSDRIYSVRGDIERLQGRRNYLLNRVQLSTIHLTLREIKDYKPPTAPTFGSRIQDNFATSWEALVNFVQDLFLVGVSLTPWMPLLLPTMVLGVWGVRRVFHKTGEGTRPAVLRPDHSHRGRTRDEVSSDMPLPSTMPAAGLAKPPGDEAPA